MKKIITISTGIVLLVTILGAWGCTRANGQNKDRVTKKVTIYLRSIEINGEKHLSMFDTNGRLETDSLCTLVMEGSTVFWELDNASGIDKIERIYSPKEKKIFKEDAQKQIAGKGFKLKVPNGIPPGTTEKYIIKYVGQDNKKAEIDPYIRIRD